MSLRRNKIKKWKQIKNDQNIKCEQFYFLFGGYFPPFLSRKKMRKTRRKRILICAFSEATLALSPRFEISKYNRIKIYFKSIGVSSAEQNFETTKMKETKYQRRFFCERNEGNAMQKSSNEIFSFLGQRYDLRVNLRLPHACLQSCSSGDGRGDDTAAGSPARGRISNQGGAPSLRHRGGGRERPGNDVRKER